MNKWSSRKKIHEPRNKENDGASRTINKRTKQGKAIEKMKKGKYRRLGQNHKPE